MNKRHAKPTSRQLLERIYRRQIAIDARLDVLESHLDVDLHRRTGMLRTITEHCIRLLGEKATLMELVHREQLSEANRFMARRA